MEVTAVIVVRKGSKRVKAKSMLELDGESLISRKVKQLLKCKNVNRVVVGSDSDEMLEEARIAGAEAVRRPDFYCNEEIASANDMIKNMCELITTDVVVWAHCTNPMLSTNTYEQAVDKFFEVTTQGYDSLLSVVELKEHLWNTNKTVFNYNPYAERHTPARELPPMYMQDGGIFIQPYINMKKNSYFFGQKPYLFEIPKDEFLDINEYRDYLLAKAIIQEKKEQG